MSFASRLAISSQEFNTALRYAIHARNNLTRRVRLGQSIVICIEIA
jgi:hypothetical protein